jgi:protein phosphatase
MRLLAWGDTDSGRKRDHNEDAHLVDPQRGLFVVADGMGGHRGGDQASRMAVEVMRSMVANLDHTTAADDRQLLTMLRDATRAASSAIYERSAREPSLHGMGTTMTTLLLSGGRAHLAHVGDSRAYRYRDGSITQLTDDHSWIQEQVRAGLLTPEEAQRSRFKHIITRSIGFERDVLVDLRQLPCTPGDCFLLCSDGLANHVEEAELAALLTTEYYRRVPQVLIDLANERGGEDNITIVMVYLANDRRVVVEERSGGVTTE